MTSTSLPAHEQDLAKTLVCDERIELADDDSSDEAEQQGGKWRKRHPQKPKVHDLA